MNGRKVAVGAVALAVLGLVSHGLAEKDKQGPAFMRQKLVYAQGVLEGLTLENFDMIFTNSIKLRSMRLTNAFFILGNQEYAKQVTNSQAKAEALGMAAQERNLEHATEAYMKVAQSCVECHRSFRREQFLKRQESGEK
jgi:hypothetical protein